MSPTSRLNGLAPYAMLGGHRWRLAVHGGEHPSRISPGRLSRLPWQSPAHASGVTSPVPVDPTSRQGLRPDGDGLHRHGRNAESEFRMDPLLRLPGLFILRAFARPPVSSPYGGSSLSEQASEATTPTRRSPRSLKPGAALRSTVSECPRRYRAPVIIIIIFVLVITQ